MTFVVPLCILNADIPAHISDDSGVFIQGDEESGSSSPHRGRGCCYTDDTLLLRLLYVCMYMCMSEHPLRYKSHRLTWLVEALPVSGFISHPVKHRSHPHVPSSACAAEIFINENQHYI